MKADNCDIKNPKALKREKAAFPLPESMVNDDLEPGLGGVVTEEEFEEYKKKEPDLRDVDFD